MVDQLVDDAPHLLISSFPNDFLHRLNTFFRFCSRLDDPCIDHGHLFKQIRPELIIRRVKLDCSLHYVMGRYYSLMSRIILVGPNDWSIHGLEAVSESLLCTQYIPPRVSPCFGRVDDLTNDYQQLRLSEEDNVKYLSEHFVGFFEVFEQHSNLGFICTPWQEFAKSPLHALHFGGFERSRMDFY